MTETESIIPPISNWKLFFEVLSKQPSIIRAWYWLLPLLLVYVALVVSEPYFYKLFVDTLQTSLAQPELLAETSTFFVKISIAWVALVLLSIVTSTLYQFAINTLANTGWKTFCLNTSKKVFHLPMEYHVSTSLGKRQKIYDRGIQSVWDVAWQTYIVILPQVLIFISLLVFGFYINQLMMLISLFVLPIGAIISMTVGKRAHKLQRSTDKLWDRVFGRFMDGLTNLSIVRLYAREKYEGEIL